MADKIRASVSRSRDINMFGELSHANRVLLENATKQLPGYFCELMACLVITAFKHEAFINHLGFRVLPIWGTIERSSHHNKLKRLSTHLNMTIDHDRRPFQTLRDLFAARDQLAHGKPARLEHKNVAEHGTREEMRRRKPLTKWESLCTVDFLTRCYDDTEKVAEMMWKAAGLKLSDLRARGHGYTIAAASDD